jgi:imidazolonepropionase-like amidohydrolase
MLKFIAKTAIFLTFLFPVLVSAQPENRYSFLMMGKPAGAQISKMNSAGFYEYDFEYNDRGRGPKLKTRIRLDGDGIPTSVETVGNDYLKAPVNETFSLKNEVANWKNSAENGEKKLTGKAFYITMSGVPEEMALLANALLRSPNKRLELLPAGEASIEKAVEVILKEGDQTRKVTSYEISGLDLTPVTVWLDESGAFFASVSSWSSVIREGWEAKVAELLKVQDEREAARYSHSAKTLTRQTSRPIAFINANLFDAETAKIIPNSTVIVSGNLIGAVGKKGDIPIPQNAEIIDAKGKTLMPGLWDMHVHIFPGQGLLHIAAGVTSVRDLANDTEQLIGLKKKIETGEEIGPRIMMTGFMDGRGAYTGPTKVLVDSEEEAKTAIENYARLGYTGIKIYSSIKVELVPKIIEMAHAKGLRVGGHVPAFMTAEQFIKAGADEIQHTNFLFLNFLFDKVQDTRTPARFIAVAENAATIDLNSKEVSNFIKLLQDNKTVVDPTLSIFEGMFTDRPGKMSAGFAPIADRLPTQIRRGLLAGGLPVPEGKDGRYHDSATALLKMVKRLYDSGIPLVAGTDSFAGFALHRELELYAEAGIPASKVLQIATLNSAKIMKREAELGSIKKGKLADLILVDGNPAERISDIRRVSLVVKDGKIYDPAALYKSVGVRP